MMEAKRRVGLTLGAEGRHLAAAWMRCGCQVVEKGTGEHDTPQDSQEQTWGVGKTVWVWRGAQSGA